MTRTQTLRLVHIQAPPESVRTPENPADRAFTIVDCLTDCDALEMPIGRGDDEFVGVVQCRRYGAGRTAFDDAVQVCGRDVGGAVLTDQ